MLAKLPSKLVHLLGVTQFTSFEKQFQTLLQMLPVAISSNKQFLERQ